MPFTGHCDLDLVFRIIVSGAYLILLTVGIPNLVTVWMQLLMPECHILFSSHFDLDL